MIDPKDLDEIAEAVADQIVDTAKRLGFKPKKKQEEGRLPDDVMLKIYDTMPQNVKDFLRRVWGEEVWAEYEAAMEKLRGGR